MPLVFVTRVGMPQSRTLTDQSAMPKLAMHVNGVRATFGACDIAAGIGSTRTLPQMQSLTAYAKTDVSTQNQEGNDLSGRAHERATLSFANNFTSPTSRVVKSMVATIGMVKRFKPRGEKKRKNRALERCLHR